MTGQIGLAGAFLGGLLALLSPCAALLLPSLFAFTYDGARALVSRTGLFFLGLAAVLIPIGAGVAAMGSLFTDHRATVTAVGALVIIAFGVVIIVGSGFGFGPLSQLANRVSVAGPVSTVLLGAVYAFAGFCSGPLLGAVLTVGLVSGSPWYGAAVMAAYAAGMTAPLLLLALFWERIGPRLNAVLRGREITVGGRSFHTTSLISGLALIVIGILLWATEGTASLGSPVGADTQLRWQGALADWASSISNLEVVTALVAVIVVILAVRAWRRRA
ncbi:putative thiol-disulfide oxidoreductase [Gordonia hirsuta DSM 44140 = NBRC 16056]|uniref:Putative thiol-disulfide oxidoreductase n=1 Tax=Gordonia hirsuta DSM 44140 = NBRC 16056 TaxID=1121927 RepID=L7L5Y3_9ACTN|nr:cytochrome c biogenesis protein CcdA [Gordonia hirsuta]GAC56161.1 putative thiol-disulfide oxidoreductase [Gordonia hirsuta DSM 44140 = NBRC 16056]